MGDINNVSGMVGAVGSNARAENNSFNQVWQQSAAGIDLSALAIELSTLRASMRQQANEIEHDQAIANIAEAEVAAKRQDGATALKYLKSAGKWAFDIATKIGTSVAAKAIQTALGV